MKKYLLLTVWVLGLGSMQPTFLMAAPFAYQAADQTPPPPEKVVEMMSSKLSLSDDQKTQITPIIADRQQKMMALKGDTSMRKMKKAREAKSIMDDSDKKIEAVLNDDQKKKYAEIKEEMKEKMKEQRENAQ
ncbi:MAG: hypothetical protein PW789_08455 [Edaphobacter sp.]|uniref:hypothetical protein n=1 Tax=Edaphobacter sp. TaxID=1934404 RepID=UPI00239A5D6A|nr:hypothetical protein [Edaphobacter sp.]MDE1176626.1 hypothetical protein [Edaphobacter sp.]